MRRFALEFMAFLAPAYNAGVIPFSVMTLPPDPPALLLESPAWTVWRVILLAAGLFFAGVFLALLSVAIWLQFWIRPFINFIVPRFLK